MPKILVKDVKIYYETLGEGEPICLIMGWGGSSVIWYRQREMLAKSYKVILIDNRGTGRSSKPKYPYTMQMFVDDVKAVLDHLNISKLHLMGCSMGGMISQQFALTYPDMLSSLILCCTAASTKMPNVNDVDPEKLFIMTEVTPESLRSMFSLIFTTKYIDWLFSDDGRAEFNKLIIEMAKYPPTMKGMKNQFSAIQDHDVVNRLGEIKIPTLILVGKNDVLLPPRNSKIIHKNIANSELQILEGGHMFWIEAEKEFNKAVIDFLSKHKIN
ncbi:MAG: alpha/beta fold hydrolase [Candidatus Hodarchaeota archaeon]